MISKDAKYIVFDNGLNYVPIVFPNYVTHNSIAMMFGSWTAEGAGFVRVDSDGTVEAYGRSVGLNLDSNPDIDTKLLTKLFNK
jgi:hypothetical protein